jgi:hypothetical protein
MIVRFDPLAKALYDSLGESVYNLAKKVHRVPLGLDQEVTILPQNRENCAYPDEDATEGVRLAFK